MSARAGTEAPASSVSKAGAGAAGGQRMTAGKVVTGTLQVQEEEEQARKKREEQDGWRSSFVLL